MTRAKGRRRRPILTLLVILTLFPLAGVAVHRFLPPLATILMVKQAAAGQERLPVARPRLGPQGAGGGLHRPD